MEPLTMLAALAPLVVEGGKALINRFVVPDTYKPANIAEVIQLQQLEIDKFKAINDAGGVNPTYPWVEAVIRMQRPAVAFAVIGTWAVCRMGGYNCGAEVDNFAAAIGFYLFGDRSLFYAKQK